MNYLKLKQKIYEAIERNPLDRSAYEEMFAVCREYEKIDFQTAHAWNHELRNHISWGLRMTVSCQKFDEAREFDDLMFRSLLFGAQHFFDDYLQAVEYGKPLDKKFYQPRRHYLRRYVDAYQEILDGKLDFLSISMPKRAGKSQLGMGFLQDGSEVAFIQYNKLHINAVEAMDRLSVGAAADGGYFDFISTEYGMGVKWRAVEKTDNASIVSVMKIPRRASKYVPVVDEDNIFQMEGVNEE